jgi:hypothetical protein
MMIPDFSSTSSLQGRKSIVLIILFVCFLFNYSFAQHFIKMTDEQRIQLALDMIRKGIQQQDTTKVFMVFGPQVWVKGKSTEVKGNLTKTLQGIFDNSSKRKTQIEKPPFPRADNPLHFSNFWDFDILDPEIKIVGDPAGGGKGDSAIVDCELVLWGAQALKGSDQAGTRVRERFIFKSPAKIEQLLPSEDWHKWPTRPLEKNERKTIRSWQLVRFENLLDFLNGEVSPSSKKKEEK